MLSFLSDRVVFMFSFQLFI